MVFARVSRVSRPSSTSRMISAAVNVLDTLATENAVSAVTGRPAATSARPDRPRQTEPSAKTIATDTPGIA